MTQLVADVVIVVFVCAAAWWDVSTGRIPNELTIAGLAVALILRAPLGIEPLLQGVVGLGVALAVSLVLYVIGAIGGGDAKLLAGVGAFLGSTEIVDALGLIAVLGAAYAVLSVARRGLLPLLVFRTFDLIKTWLSLGRPSKDRKLESPGALTVPYGIPIALGTLICWFGWGVRL